jgi:tetratricopeptide (TPR) repeat protein
MAATGNTTTRSEMRKRLAIAGMVAALAATISLTGNALRDPGESAEASSSPGGTAALVASLEKTTRRDAKDARAYLELGLAYQQLTRETGDAAYYPRSERALWRALALEPRNPTTVGALGSLALARHDFRGALAYGRRAARLAPYSALHYGVIGDAMLELGRYEGAFAAFDRMAQLRPSSSAYARVSYARELLGRPQEAEEAMQLAFESAAGHQERSAWVLAHLGKLALAQGKTAAAARRFRAALAVSPAYGPAFEGLGHVDAARGRLAQAIVLMKGTGRSASAAESLGDLYRLTGQGALARHAYQDAFEYLRYESRYGVHMSLDLATFQVDRGIRLGEGLALARRGYRDRPSVVGDDALGWALVRNGRCREGLTYARRALRLGTRDASWVFHRAMAERCVGNHAQARKLFRRALEINPHFSILWSRVARQHAT